MSQIGVMPHCRTIKLLLEGALVQRWKEKLLKIWSMKLRQPLERL